MPTNEEYAVRVKTLVNSDKLRIAKRHIEYDRAYRNIQVADVEEVLKAGRVTAVALDKRIEWQGKDTDGRKIKLLCRLKTCNHEDTLVILDAELVSVETAYEVGIDDSQLKKDFLAKNPDWQENLKGHVEKRK